MRMVKSTGWTKDVLCPDLTIDCYDFSIAPKKLFQHFLVCGFNPFEQNISQIGSAPQIGMTIKNDWNHHPGFVGMWQVNSKIVCFWVPQVTPFGWSQPPPNKRWFKLHKHFTKMFHTHFFTCSWLRRGDPLLFWKTSTYSAHIYLYMYTYFILYKNADTSATMPLGQPPTTFVWKSRYLVPVRYQGVQTFSAICLSRNSLGFAVPNLVLLMDNSCTSWYGRYPP